MATRTEAIEQIKFAIEQLSVKNAQHEFEHLCRHLARIKICSNILPATGPVQSGGDQGRDFETFKSYIQNSPISEQVFIGLISNIPIAFACSLEQKPDIENGKIQSDVKTIIGSGSKIDCIYFFSSRDIVIFRRHKLIEWAKNMIDVKLEILDRQAISELLSESSTFWIASEYLKIPDKYYDAIVNEENMNLRNNFIFEISNLNKPSQAQIKKFNEFIRLISQDKQSVPLDLVINLVAVDQKFNSFSRENLYRAFDNANIPSDTVRKTIGNIFNYVALISMLMGSAKTFAEDFAKIVNENKKIITENLSNLREIQNQYAIQVNLGNINIKEDLFVLGFLGTYEEYRKTSDKYKLFFGKESLIEPLDKLIKNYLQTDARTIELNKIIRTCNHSYKLISDGLENTRKKFSELVNKFENSKNEINTYLTQLKKWNRKSSYVRFKIWLNDLFIKSKPPSA